ncbi:MAG: VanZ family protein [Pyrinomonadaceae bacterium]
MNSEVRNDLQRARRIAFTLLFFWAAVILLLGSGQGSMAQTSRFIRPLIEFFFPAAAPETVLLIHAFVRKTAHFIEYFIFSLLAVRAFSIARKNAVSEWRFPLAVGAAFLLAVVDESLQSFNVSRTSSPFDVLIDLSGAAAAAAVYWIFSARGRRPSPGSTAV